ncbi:MAG: M28 family peptidase [Planctomycetota bacterium]
MARPRPAAVLFASIAVLASLRAQQPATTSPPAVDPAITGAPFVVGAAELFGHVQFLASPELAGRKSGSSEGAIAGAYVAAEFGKLGLTPAGVDGTFWQPFDRIELVVREVDGEPKVEQRTITCRNVLAWLPGSDPARADEYVLVAAHYDHLGRVGDAIHPGADDNASGTAGLLGVAKALATGPRRPRRSVLFAAFDAEEQALSGAETFARKPSRTLQQAVAMINLDMIGRGKLLDRKSMALGKRLAGVPKGPAIGVLGTSQSPELAALTRAVFAAEQLPLFAPEDFGVLGPVIEKQAEGRSDHAPFERRRIPFLFFSNSEHDDYHQPTDTIATLDQTALWRTTACVYRTVLAIDALEARPTFVAKGQPAADAAGQEPSGK